MLIQLFFLLFPPLFSLCKSIMSESAPEANSPRLVWGWTGMRCPWLPRPLFTCRALGRGSIGGWYLRENAEQTTWSLTPPMGWRSSHPRPWCVPTIALGDCGGLPSSARWPGHSQWASSTRLAHPGLGQVHCLLLHCPAHGRWALLPSPLQRLGGTSAQKGHGDLVQVWVETWQLEVQRLRLISGTETTSPYPRQHIPKTWYRPGASWASEQAE